MTASRLHFLSNQESSQQPFPVQHNSVEQIRSQGRLEGLGIISLQSITVKLVARRKDLIVPEIITLSNTGVSQSMMARVTRKHVIRFHQSLKSRSLHAKGCEATRSMLTQWPSTIRALRVARRLREAVWRLLQTISREIMISQSTASAHSWLSKNLC